MSASGGEIEKRLCTGSTVTRSCEGSWVAVALTSRLKSARIRCTVSDPIPIANTHRITNVSAAETTARRVRMGSRSKPAERRSLAPASAARTLSAKDVAGSPDRVQQARLAPGLELAAQVGHEHLDRVRG